MLWLLVHRSRLLRVQALNDIDSDKADLMRRPSRKMRENWQQSRDEKIKMQDMRSLRQVRVCCIALATLLTPPHRTSR